MFPGRPASRRLLSFLLYPVAVQIARACPKKPGGTGGAVRGPALAHRAAEKLSRSLPPPVPKKTRRPGCPECPDSRGASPWPCPRPGQTAKPQKDPESRQYKKSAETLSRRSLFWCGRWDLNPHVMDTRTSNVPVCRFQHFRRCRRDRARHCKGYFSTHAAKMQGLFFTRRRAGLAAKLRSGKENAKWTKKRLRLC